VTDRLRQLWQEHERAPFPEGLAGEEINGVDLVLIDADIAGAIASSVDAPRNLDPTSREALVLCRADLERVLPHLSNTPEGLYFARLAAMADLALAAR
jgi:hypothetical protein